MLSIKRENIPSETKWDDFFSINLHVTCAMACHKRLDLVHVDLAVIRELAFVVQLAQPEDKLIPLIQESENKN